MTSEEQHLEGNAAGGVLGQVFAVEMTTAEVICAHCDAIGPISAALVYAMAMGMIIRYPGCCGEALMRIAHGPQCTHLKQIVVTQTDSHVCEECTKIGDRWVHVRMCLICGHVGCCDSSKNK
jgi:hypothetical protein